MFIHLQPKLMTGIKLFRIRSKTLAAALRHLPKCCIVVDETYEPAEPIFSRGELRGEVMIWADNLWVFSIGIKVPIMRITDRNHSKRHQRLHSSHENKMHVPLSRTALLKSSAPAMSASGSTSGGNEKCKGLSGLLP
jgi:hypothetical protein